jgi:DNA-binding NtrC family response regulator
VRQAIDGAPALAGLAPAEPVVGKGRLPRHVLIVDDERVGREALTMLLSSYGCTVHGASDLPQARQLLAANLIEAVVSDDRLPGDSSGLAFLLALRGSSPHLRTLLVTGETAPQRISEIKASGVPFLHKPVQAQQLLDALVR